MGDLVLLAIFLVILCGVAVVINKHLNNARRPALWKVQEHSLPNNRGVMVYIECPGEEPMAITKDPIPLDSDFDFHIELAHMDAEMMRDALNTKILRQLER